MGRVWVEELNDSCVVEILRFLTSCFFILSHSQKKVKLQKFSSVLLESFPLAVFTSDNAFLSLNFL